MWKFCVVLKYTFSEQNDFRIQILVKYKLVCPVYTLCSIVLHEMMFVEISLIGSWGKVDLSSSRLYHCRLSKHGFQLCLFSLLLHTAIVTHKLNTSRHISLTFLYSFTTRFIRHRPWQSFMNSCESSIL